MIERNESSAATPSRAPTTAEIAETLLDYNECLAWAEQFKGTPFNMLPLATVAAKAAGPLLVMRSLFALAAENKQLEQRLTSSQAAYEERTFQCERLRHAAVNVRATLLGLLSDDNVTRSIDLSPEIELLTEALDV